MNKQEEKQTIRDFFNPDPPDALNREGKSYITTSPDRVPQVCGICGKDAVTSSSMAWIWVGLCEEHKEGSLSVGQPCVINLNGEFHNITGGVK